jgi:8-oxo-dGTP pyrophosphatase MutT (NUDIX family)
VLLRGTRILAIVALLALAAGIVSDVFEGDFWARHALLAGLAASVIVVMISVAVIYAVLERRRRERWSILAQFVMLELVRNARLIWTGVLAQVGLLSVDAARPESVDANGRIVRDTPPLTAAVRHTIADDALRRELHEEITLLAAHTDEVLGRWAAVMLNADVYAEVIDRHVELASDISWLVSLLDNAEPPQDYRRQRRASSSPAVQVEGQIAGEDLAARIVVITQLAEELDRNTLDLALRIVPVEWWQTRLGATVPLDGGVANG